MPVRVLNDRYWLLRYDLKPPGVTDLASLPLEHYLWWPLIDQAEHVAQQRDHPPQK